MTNTIRFLFMAYRAYKQAKKSGKVTYSAVLYRGVPSMCFFIGVGREAWRITQRAVDEFEPESRL